MAHSDHKQAEEMNPSLRALAKAGLRLTSMNETMYMQVDPSEYTHEEQIRHKRRRQEKMQAHFYHSRYAERVARCTMIGTDSC